METPYTKLYGKDADFSTLRVIGARDSCTSSDAREKGGGPGVRGTALRLQSQQQILEGLKPGRQNYRGRQENIFPQETLQRAVFSSSPNDYYKIPPTIVCATSAILGRVSTSSDLDVSD